MHPSWAMDFHVKAPITNLSGSFIKNSSQQQCLSFTTVKSRSIPIPTNRSTVKQGHEIISVIHANSGTQTTRRQTKVAITRLKLNELDDLTCSWNTDCECISRWHYAAPAQCWISRQNLKTTLRQNKVNGLRLMRSEVERSDHLLLPEGTKAGTVLEKMRLRSTHSGMQTIRGSD